MSRIKEELYVLLIGILQIVKFMVAVCVLASISYLSDMLLFGVYDNTTFYTVLVILGVWCIGKAYSDLD